MVKYLSVDDGDVSDFFDCNSPRVNLAGQSYIRADLFREEALGAKSLSVPAELTTEEFQYAIETETIRRDPLWDSFSAEDAREAGNDEVREMLVQLRALDRFTPAMASGGNGAMVRRLNRLINTSPDANGNLDIDMNDAQEVLGAFVGLTVAAGLVR